MMSPPEKIRIPKGGGRTTGNCMEMHAFGISICEFGISTQGVYSQALFHTNSTQVALIILLLCAAIAIKMEQNMWKEIMKLLQ